MLRRDLLKVLGLSFVPLPGLVMGAPTHGRITLSSGGVAIVEKPIEYRLNSIMTIMVQGLDQTVTFDSCELYRPGDSEPFLRRPFEPIRVGPAHSLELAWSVDARAKDSIVN